MKALVVGYGSIGERHTRLLAEIGCDVAVVSSRNAFHGNLFGNITEAVAGYRPDYVIIANKTHQHYVAVQELAETGCRGTVLVEKPLFHKPMDLPANSFNNCFVAYNLRFHPVIQKLRSLLEAHKAISVSVSAGQYLPKWRPGTNYRLSYSAHADKGGGVLRDLSHELDYVNWIFGNWNQIVAVGGHYSSLQISSDDIYAIMMRTERCPVITLQMDYLSRTVRREIIVNTDEHTIEADLIRGTVTVDGSTDNFTINRDFTYRSLHKAVLEGKHDFLCPVSRGMEVMKTIHAAEESERLRKWISR